MPRRMEQATFGEGPTLSLTTPVWPGPPADVPERIGCYRILAKLGEGGMGVVFEAEQPSPRRRVAVKIMRGGFLIDDDRLRSFEREIQTLARLKHPGIAAIYESGTTEDGQPFFAMELVRGESLAEYLRKRPPPTGAEEIAFRLALFCRIADAVHYAHQRGVIHRDLKPSNIVVAGQAAADVSLSGSSLPSTTIELPEVKVLDFGLARWADAEVAALSMQTELGVIKGTLSHMSPEQARGLGDQIDSRTDVYSLGVILFEALTGTRPYDTDARSIVRSIRIICEETSRTLADAAGHRFDADLETIVGKALEKTIDRRYDSAAAIAADVRRYLASQPILARPPSTVYQLRKFATRNRALVGGVIATILVLLAGVVVSSLFALRETHQRRAADSARAELRSVVDFQARMLREMDPVRMGRGLVADLRQRLLAAGSPEQWVDERLAALNSTDLALELVDEHILERAAAELDELFADQPIVEAELRHILGDIYHELGKIRPAELHTERALELRMEELGPDHPDTLSTMALLAHELTVLSHSQASEHAARHERARGLYEAALAGRRRALGSKHPQTLESLDDAARFSWYEGAFARAEGLYVEALAGLREILGDSHPRTHEVMFEMACMYAWSERPAEAEALFRETLAAQRAVGQDRFGMYATMRELGRLYYDLGRLDESRALLEEVLLGWSELLGTEHRYTRGTALGLGEIHLDRGELEAAESYLAPLLEVLRRRADIDRLILLDAAHDLGDLYAWAGRRGRARELWAEALAVARENLPPVHPTVVALEASLADRMEFAGEAHLLASLPPRYRARAAALLPHLDRVTDGSALASLAGELEAAGPRFAGASERRALAALAARLRGRAGEIGS